METLLPSGRPHFIDGRDVLNHGHVILLEMMGNDLSIVRNARQCYDADWRVGEDEKGDARLIYYLWKNRHTTPFEAVTFTFGIKCPIFVARQWHRHRTWSYNEVSARYVELPEEFYVPELDKITTQSASNKQARTDEQHRDAALIQEIIREDCKASHETYKDLLERGCPRELARSVLPVATYTRFSGTVNLLNLFRFLELRLHAHAQYEIRVYAEAMLDLIRPIVPVAVSAFEVSRRG